MTVELNDNFDVYVVNYDTDLVKGETASLRAVNPNNMEDISTRDDFKNDGNVFVAYPAGYEGSSNVTITGSDGGEDTGEITVPL